MIKLNKEEIIPLKDIKGIDKVSMVNPLMDDLEYNALLESIKLRGQLDPVVTHRGFIVDGRNRFNALTELTPNGTIKVIRLPHKIPLVDKKGFVMDKETRRHQSATQKACKAVYIWNTDKPKNTTQKEFVKSYGTSIKNFANAQWVYKNNRMVFKALQEGLKVQVDANDKYKVSESLSAVVKYLKAQVIGVKDEEAEHLGQDAFSVEVNTAVNYHMNALLRELDRINVPDESLGAVTKDIATQIYSMFSSKSKMKLAGNKVSKGTLKSNET